MSHVSHANQSATSLASINSDKKSDKNKKAFIFMKEWNGDIRLLV